MPNEDAAVKIVRAYHSLGIPAKLLRGQLYIERETGWEGPIEPESVQWVYADELRALVSEVRGAASRVFANLGEDDRILLRDSMSCYYVPPEVFLRRFLSEPDRYEALGVSSRRARLHATVASYLDLWKEFQL